MSMCKKEILKSNYRQNKVVRGNDENVTREEAKLSGITEVIHPDICANIMNAENAMGKKAGLSTKGKL